MGGRGMRMDPDRQLERLTRELNLTTDQQAQIKPLLVERQQKMQALFQDQSAAPKIAAPRPAPSWKVPTTPSRLYSTTNRNRSSKPCRNACTVIGGGRRNDLLLHRTAHLLNPRTKLRPKQCHAHQSRPFSIDNQLSLVPPFD